MKFKFLGTSAGLPLPRINCDDNNICLSKDFRDKRLRSVALVDGRVLIDCGPDIYSQILKEGMPKIEAVIFTHHHIDHILGAYNFVDKYGKQTAFFGTKEVFTKMRRFAQNKNPMKEYQPNNPINFGTFSVTPFAVKHARSVTNAILVKAKRTLVYASDFDGIPKENWHYLTEADILVLDASSFGHSPGHLPLDEVITLTKPLKKTVYFTHIGIKTLPHKEFTDYVKEKGGEKYNVAYDGLELNI